MRSLGFIHLVMNICRYQGSVSNPPDNNVLFSINKDIKALFPTKVPSYQGSISNPPDIKVLFPTLQISRFYFQPSRYQGSISNPPDIKVLFQINVLFSIRIDIKALFPTLQISRFYFHPFRYIKVLPAKIDVNSTVFPILLYIHICEGSMTNQHRYKGSILTL